MFSFIVLLIIIFATFYVALMYLNASLIMVCYMEAALCIAAFIYLMFCKIALKTSIKIPVGISEIGRENIIKINIKNRSRLPVVRLKACLVVHETIKGTKKKYNMKLDKVMHGKNEYVKKLAFAEAGNYEVILKKIRVYDMTGLMSWAIPVKKSSTVQIMPKIHDMPVRLSLAVKNFYGESDVYDEQNPGHDNSELFKVREYQKGDRLQNVHWKMTAKHDELMVKEHSLPKACPVVFLLDNKAGRGSRKTATAYIEAAVSMAFSIMDAGCAHYIAWFDDKEKDIKRMRVDDEESLFYFIGIIMKVKWTKYDGQLAELYKNKYKSENYLWMLELNEKLQVIKSNDIPVQLSKKELEKSLSECELIL